MKEKLLTLLLPTLIQSLLSSFPEETIKRLLDSWIDQLEDYISLTQTKVDDTLLPIIYMIRNLFDIPDYPDAPAASSKKA